MIVIESLDGHHIGDEVKYENGVVTFPDGDVMSIDGTRVEDGGIIFLYNSNYQIRVKE
jgi:hypothetical protein